MNQVVGGILASFRKDRMTVTRVVKYKTDSGETKERDETVYEDIPCRLSFSSTDAPADTDRLPDMRYTATLFYSDEIRLKQGDRVTVTKEGRVYTGLAGIGMVYPSHIEMPLAIHER